MFKRLAFLLILILSMIPMFTVDAHSPIEKRFPNVNAVIESAPDQVELFFKIPYKYIGVPLLFKMRILQKSRSENRSWTLAIIAARHPKRGSKTLN
ncbi:hypothetical protein M5X11_21140 [Paenibacillus alginolyticus]|uniref:hypothetical protein n=1 Tax=Paenibacillus alginolyticus TaxID=59839 RepID=UPI0004923FF8|nr:hypothetical protein [Paenibacillus alginolyticus]MCY9667399.1 hypothetical protein [Paenibacillus alginolyticus]